MFPFVLFGSSLGALAQSPSPGILPSSLAKLQATWHCSVFVHLFEPFGEPSNAEFSDHDLGRAW